MRAQSDAEAGVIEVNDLVEVGSGTVMKVGGARGEAAQDRALELADVGPLASDRGPGPGRSSARFRPLPYSAACTAAGPEFVGWRRQRQY